MWRATGLHFRNHILTGLPATTTHLPVLQEGDVSDEDDAGPEPKVLDLGTKEYNGWRCSYKRVWEDNVECGCLIS